MLIQDKALEARSNLAAAITRSASRQTYYTVRFLVDRELIADAYRAYAYFRWLDDQLDTGGLERSARLGLANRERALVDQCYGDPADGRLPQDLCGEEYLLVDLIRGDLGRSDRERLSGLQSYIRNMMAVMAFDAGRRGQLISQRELAQYSRWLATAVTEALHYFIGHESYAPHGGTRYLAATAAHIAHMLRDTVEDNAAGYFNIPREFLAEWGITALDTGSDAYRAWVKHRVEVARAYFKAGKDYLAQVGSGRCRLAGYAYIARFDLVLDAIERDGYLLRSDYGTYKSPGMALRLGAAVCWSALKPQRPQPAPRRKTISLI